MGLLRLLPGAGRVLAAHAPALPQPDQLCGPFAAWVALHAVLDDPPSVTDLAVAAGTRVWPHDVPGWRPPGATVRRDGWDALPLAADPAQSGTNAAGLAAGVAALRPDVVVVPATGLPPDLGPGPVGVVANLRTGPVAPAGLTWDVGHFVVLWGTDAGRVAVADSYAELGEPGLPSGCRLVDAEALAGALVGRGVLLLVSSTAAGALRRRVRDAGLHQELWAR